MWFVWFCFYDLSEDEEREQWIYSEHAATVVVLCFLFFIFIFICFYILYICGYIKLTEKGHSGVVKTSVSQPPSCYFCKFCILFHF